MDPFEVFDKETLAKVEMDEYSPPEGDYQDLMWSDWKEAAFESEDEKDPSGNSGDSGEIHSGEEGEDYSDSESLKKKADKKERTSQHSPIITDGKFIYLISTRKLQYVNDDDDK